MFGGLDESFGEGLAATVAAIGYGVPLRVLAFFAALPWRWSGEQGDPGAVLKRIHREFRSESGA